MTLPSTPLCIREKLPVTVTPCLRLGRPQVEWVFQPIVVQAGAYEARTDGTALEIRRLNGVVVGEGRIGLFQGSFCVGEYTGDIDPEVYKAVQELLKEHQSDIVVRWMARDRQGALS
jgi:hypothetical protein